MSRRLIVAGLCAGFAVLLYFSLLQSSVKKTIFWCDLTQTVEGPSTDAVLFAHVMVYDSFCGGRRIDGRPVSAVDAQSGLFARAGLPALPAVIGGFVIPVLLACFAAFLALQTIPARGRVGFSWLLMGMGGIGFGGIILLVTPAIYFQGYANLDWAPLFLRLVPLATGLAAGIWLYRNRPSKKPV